MSEDTKDLQVKEQETLPEEPVRIDRPVESDFTLEKPEDENIIVDPENGFKTFKLDKDGCQPGYKWNAKFGRCMPEEEAKTKPKPLNGEENQAKPF